jgi:hypothetical protein
MRAENGGYNLAGYPSGGSQKLGGFGPFRKKIQSKTTFNCLKTDIYCTGLQKDRNIGTLGLSPI